MKWVWQDRSAFRGTAAWVVGDRRRPIASSIDVGCRASLARCWRRWSISGRAGDVAVGIDLQRWYWLSRWATRRRAGDALGERRQDEALRRAPACSGGADALQLARLLRLGICQAVHLSGAARCAIGSAGACSSMRGRMMQVLAVENVQARGNGLADGERAGSATSERHMASKDARGAAGGGASV